MVLVDQRARVVVEALVLRVVGRRQPVLEDAAVAAVEDGRSAVVGLPAGRRRVGVHEARRARNHALERAPVAAQHARERVIGFRPRMQRQGRVGLATGGRGPAFVTHPVRADGPTALAAPAGLPRASEHARDRRIGASPAQRPKRCPALRRRTRRERGRREQRRSEQQRRRFGEGGRRRRERDRGLELGRRLLQHRGLTLTPCAPRVRTGREIAAQARSGAYVL